MRRSVQLLSSSCAIVCLALACSDPGPSLPRLAPDAVIVAFGDSLTYGTGAATSQSYPVELARVTGRTVINAGKPGELSAAGLERMESVLDRERPDLLILCHGGNDLLQKRSLGDLEHNLREMVRMAGDRGVPVLLIGVPAPGLFLESQELYERIAGDFGLPYEGEIVPEVLSRGSLKSDLVHPNAKGYRRVAEAVRDRLVRAGAI
jgi:lysophospholipase L1-like esterase